MYTNSCKIRVRYGETDQMGYVYYGRYADYFEVGRVEALRSLGLTYKELEESGVMLPVLEFSINYLKPAYYDDLLTVTNSIAEMPRSRITFQSSTSNEAGELLNEGEVVLVFVNAVSKKPCAAPRALIEKLKPYF